MPRLVKFPQKEGKYYHPERIEQNRFDVFDPPTAQAPSILRVNKESNREIAPLYRNYIGFDQPRSPVSPLKRHNLKYGSIPFNPSIDVLFLDPSAQLGTGWTAITST